MSIDAVSAATMSHGIALSCTGRNIAFRKTAFIEIGGYDEIQDQISGDDDLLMQKISLSKRWAIDFMCNENYISESVNSN